MILAVGIIVILSACKKENGVQTVLVQKPLTQTVPLSASIKDRAANFQNPYDSIGMVHNMVLQTVVGYQVKTGDTSVATTYKIVASFFRQRYGSDIGSQISKAEQNFMHDFPGMQVNSVPDAKLQPLTAAYINKIVTAIHDVKDSTAYGAFKSSIESVESAAINDKSLTVNEQQKVLIAASVARYSLSFWLAQTSAGNGKNDVMGFFHNIWKAINCALADTGSAIDGVIHFESPREILEDASTVSAICSAVMSASHTK